MKSTITLLSKSIINISISYSSKLSDNRDFLFESKLPVSYNLEYENNIFAYIIDIRINFIQVKNVTKVSITLYRNIRLDIVVEYSVDGYYQISYKVANLTACE